MNMRRLAVAAASALLLPWPDGGNAAADPWERLVRRLGGAAGADREAAERELVAAGAAALPAVVAARPVPGSASTSSYCGSSRTDFCRSSGKCRLPDALVDCSTLRGGGLRRLGGRRRFSTAADRKERCVRGNWAVGSSLK